MTTDRARYEEALLSAGRSAWPELAVTLEAFRDYLAAGRHVELIEVSLPRAGDLVLACACAQGDPRALKSFATWSGPEIDRALGRFHFSAGQRDEVRQQIWIRLFVADAGQRPKIAEYSGRGELLRWVRVVATRVAVDALRSTRDHHSDDTLLQALVSPTSDPEVEYSKRLYSAEISEVLTHALGRLSLRERNVLRQYFIDRLSIDELAALHRMHRATAARHVQRARDRLLEHIRRELLERLEIGRETADSILRLIESRVEIVWPT